jgi:hypothetical protein
METYFYTSSVEVPHQNYIITKIIEVGNIFSMTINGLVNAERVIRLKEG